MAREGRLGGVVLVLWRLGSRGSRCCSADSGRDSGRRSGGCSMEVFVVVVALGVPFLRRGSRRGCWDRGGRRRRCSRCLVWKSCWRGVSRLSGCVGDAILGVLGEHSDAFATALSGLRHVILRIRRLACDPGLSAKRAHDNGRCRLPHNQGPILPQTELRALQQEDL